MKTSSRVIATFALSLAFAGTASPSSADPSVHAGRASTYRSLQANSLEDVTPAEAIKRIQLENISPNAIWKLLEHAEKVECLSCIPIVAKRLYDAHPKTREISAWWLRRRIFGVFGKGEIYSQVIATLNDQKESESRRAYAANAIGEFLSPAGVRHVAEAAVKDPSARVREAALLALVRLNHEGPNQAIGAALFDEDENVRLTAVKAASSVNVFSNLSELVELIGDDSPRVRRRAAEALGSMRVRDAVSGLAALASESREASAEVRQAAVWALGQLGEPEGKSAVEEALTDSDPQVRDAARIALRRL